MEPKTLFINRPNKTKDSSKSTMIIEPNITYIEENETSDIDKTEETDKSGYNIQIPKRKKRKNSKKTIIIVLACLGGVIIIALSIFLSLYCKKKNQPQTIINQTNSNLNIKNI